jgi:hypothetical protein
VQVSDPIGQGFVASPARPGGNITGFTNFEFSISGKRLETLKEITPQVTRVRAYLVCSTSVIVRPFRVVPGADNPWSPGVLRSRPQTPHHSSSEQRQWGVRF